MKKLLFILLLAAATGCSKAGEDVPVPGPAEGSEISFFLPQVRVGVAAASRADSGLPATSAPQTEALADGVTVRVMAFQRASGATDASITADTYVAEATYVVSSGKLVPCNVDAATGAVDSGNSAAPAVIRLRADQYDFYAVTPAVAVAGPGYTVSVAHGTDHASSIRKAVAITSSPNPQEVELSPLVRRCALISFSFDRQENSKGIKKIAVDSVALGSIAHSPSAASTLCAPLSVGANDALYDKFPTGVITYTETPNPADPSNPTVTKTAFPCADEVLPKSSASYDLGLKVSFNDAAKPTRLTAKNLAAIAYVPGYQYNYKLVLKGNIIELILSVGPWNAIDWSEGGENFDFGASPQISVSVGEWNLVGWDTSMGGSGGADITVGGWTSNPDWDAEIGAFPILAPSLDPNEWNGGGEDSSGMGGNAGATTTPGDWNGDVPIDSPVGGGTEPSATPGDWDQSGSDDTSGMGGTGEAGGGVSDWSDSNTITDDSVGV